MKSSQNKNMLWHHHTADWRQKKSDFFKSQIVNIFQGMWADVLVLLECNKVNLLKYSFEVLVQWVCQLYAMLFLPHYRKIQYLLHCIYPTIAVTTSLVIYYVYVENMSHHSVKKKSSWKYSSMCSIQIKFIIVMSLVLFCLKIDRKMI